MITFKFQPVLHAAAFGGLVLLAACGGGGGDGSSSPSDATQTPGAKTLIGSSVAGPLDTVQDQLSTSVFTPLQSAVEGTVLGTVVQCTDEIVNHDVIDIADTVLAALQQQAANPANADPQALAGAMRGLIVHVSQLLGTIAGQKFDCTADAFAVDRLQNLLDGMAGTPLAPLATALQPVITDIINTVGASGQSSASMAQMRDLIAQLGTALQQGIARLPAGAAAAPIVGASLSTLSTAIGDTQALLTAALSHDVAGTSTALQTLVQNTLSNVLTRVVPLQTIEQDGGQPGAMSAGIETAITQLTTVIGNTAGHTIDASFDAALSSALGPVLQPVVNTLFPAVLGPITDALDQVQSGLDNSGPFAGTVVAPAINLLDNVLGSLLGQVSGGEGGTGDTGGTSGGDAGSGGTATGGSCVFANLPLLSMLCRNN